MDVWDEIMELLMEDIMLLSVWMEWVEKEWQEK